MIQFFAIAFLVLISFGCNSIPGVKKSIYAIPQNENYHKCTLLKIINECYILVQVEDKKYISKLAGFSFRTKVCDNSWYEKDIRKFKIFSINRWIRWRGENYQFYLRDLSEKKDFGHVIMVYKDLNGYGSITHQMLRNGEALLDLDYKGEYAADFYKIREKLITNKNGLLRIFNQSWLSRTTPKEFDLNDFPMSPPDIIGEWVPTPEQRSVVLQRELDSCPFSVRYRLG